MANTNSQDNIETLIMSTNINSFHYLYDDASVLQEHANRIYDNPSADKFLAIRLSRTVILLYIFSLEGLINRALDHFLPQKLREFFLDDEKRFRFSPLDKFHLLPLLLNEDGATFDRSRYPWSHFKELVSLRNDFVHPKHNRRAHYRLDKEDGWEWTPIALSGRGIPADSNIKLKETIYGNTKIPKDPYSILPEHINVVRKVVDDTVSELDRLLGGRLNMMGWLRSDELALTYPEGVSIEGQLEHIILTGATLRFRESAR